jgi:hypothetical protein
MSADSTALLHHALDITFYDLPSSAMIRLDFPGGAGAMIPMSLATPAVRLGASYGSGGISVDGFALTPRRLEFELGNAPASLPLLVHVLSRSNFVYGWLQVPGGVQVSIATSVERIRFVGPGYWALPLVQSNDRESSTTKAMPAAKPEATPAAPMPAPAEASGAKQKLTPTSASDVKIGGSAPRADPVQPRS